MSTEQNDLIENIRIALNKLDVVDMFGSTDMAFENLAQQCKNYLISCGYKVIDAMSPKHGNINKLDDLITHFYALLSNRVGEDQLVYRDLTRDRVTAKNLVKARMETGLNKKAALAECMLIIETFFNNIEKYHLEGDIHFGLFGQGNMAWITAKTLKIINNKYRDRQEAEEEKALEEAGEVPDDLDTDWLSLYSED